MNKHKYLRVIYIKFEYFNKKCSFPKLLSKLYVLKNRIHYYINFYSFKLNLNFVQKLSFKKQNFLTFTYYNLMNKSLSVSLLILLIIG